MCCCDSGPFYVNMCAVLFRGAQVGEFDLSSDSFRYV